jgi:hypothetical protein
MSQRGHLTRSYNFHTAEYLKSQQLMKLQNRERHDELIPKLKAALGDQYDAWLIENFPYDEETSMVEYEFSDFIEKAEKILEASA